MITSVAPSTRVQFRQPISRDGFIDAAWWPASVDLTAELPALLQLAWAADIDVTRVTYNLHAWDPAPTRLLVDGRTVRLGGFATSDPLTVRLSDAWGQDRIDVLVVAPQTDPDVADRVLSIVGESDNLDRAQAILDRAAKPRRPSPFAGADQH